MLSQNYFLSNSLSCRECLRRLLTATSATNPKHTASVPILPARSSRREINGLTIENPLSNNLLRIRAVGAWTATFTYIA